MFLFEAAKCMHGRRNMLKGEYYGSLFLHYKPVNWNYTIDVRLQKLLIVRLISMLVGR